MIVELLDKATAYPCLVKTLTIGSSGKKNDAVYPTYAKRTLQDVTLLRTQIEDLKKESIKKEDLRIMEEKITKIVQRVSGPDNTTNMEKNTSIEDQIMKKKSIHRSMNTEDLKELNGNKSTFIKKKNANNNSMKKNIKKVTETNGRSFDSKYMGKSIKKMEQSYAVNLCLFDEKNQPNARLRNITCPDELNPWNESLQPSVLCQIPSIKRSRPIDKLLSKNNQIFNRKKSSKTPCLSRCTCFHKKPSNTSINNLLETLLKWKGDLLSNSVFNVNGVPSVISKNNYDNIKEIHHDSEFSKSKKSVIMNNNQKAESDNASHKENIIATGAVQSPLLTTSEYIGAINLDKSNDHICKCEEDKNVIHGNNANNINLLFKCLDTNKCTCEKSNDMEKCRNAKKHGLSGTFKNKNVNVIALTDIKQSYNKNNLSQEKILDVKSCTKLNSILSHKNNQTSESNFVANDGDFRVKFLGVTLTDINKSDANDPKTEKKCDKIKYKTALQRNKQQNLCSKVSSSIKSNRKEQVTDIEYLDEKSVCPNKTNECQFVKLCTNLVDNINESRNDINEFKNDNFISEILCDTKSCVCCNNNDETKNLEVNTFTLLEKHLKHKLSEFRKSYGKSTNILPEDEEKLFITILDKVKQVISSCTYSIKCECSVESNNSGSWIRFNNLLEEYLKIKIKRVQCTCIPKEESLETILPNILEQVNNLIENDFERLKDLCKLEKNSSSEFDKKNTENNCDQNTDNVRDSQHLQPDAPCMDMENVSIQALCNLGIEDKSCNAIQLKDTRDIQTSHNDLMKSHSVEVIISKCCTNLYDELMFNTCGSKKEEESTSQIISEEPLCTRQATANELCENNKELDNITSHRSLRVPYVGYTLSCSCDNFNSCFCSKTLSQSYVKNVHNIWKMLEINKKLLPNLSYIMHSIPKTVRSENNIINYAEVTDASNVPLICESQSIKNVNANDGEEIILKDSDEKLKHSEINDIMTNTLDDLISVKTECLIDDDALYWYDCCPSPRTTKNEMMHKKALYDSIYSPINKLTKHDRSDTSVKNNVTMCISKSKNCDCVMVPVCHVKMLVENIESKLANSQCICDSLSAQVCPLHSKTLFY